MKRTNTTKARTLFASILKSYPHPVDLRELHESITKQLPGVAFSTVYRIAKDLEQAGTIERADWRDRGSKYEWIEGRDHHHHITCSICGAMADVSDACLHCREDVVRAETGYLLRHHYFELEGICPQCQKLSR